MSEERRTNKVPAMIAGLTMAALLFCWQIVQVSSLFHVTSITVVGNNQASAEEIIRYSGVQLGDHILKIQLKAVAEAVGRHPQILSAVVSQQLPSKIVIEVNERIAVGVIPYFNNFVTVCRNGAILRVVPNLHNLSLPIITGISLPLVSVGDILPTTDGYRAGMDVLLALPDDLLWQVSEINVADSRRLIFYTFDNIPVHLGRGQNMERKATALREILANVRVSGIHSSGGFIDLTGDGLPVYRSVGSSQ